jgi:flagellar basal-body rod modification protein FlgD
MATISAAAGQTLGQEQFLQILVAQLQNQDPLEPASDTEFIAQLAQFNQLNGINQLNASFDQILQLQELSSGSSMLGKTVQFLSEDGTILSGKVSQVIADGNDILLRVNDGLIGLEDITGVTA